MSQITLESLDVISIFNGCYSIRVTQIMKTSFFQSQITNNFFEVFVDRNMCQMLALFIGEHKVIFRLVDLFPHHLVEGSIHRSCGRLMSYFSYHMC